MSSAPGGLGIGTSAYPEADALVTEFATRLPELLGNRLLGLYLAGSLVVGDFDPDVSDIDLVAVTEGLVMDHFPLLDAMHEEIATAYPQWRGRIEIAYIPAETLRTHRPKRSTILITSPGEPFHEREVGREWTLGWSVVGATGVALFGPPLAIFLTPLSRTEYLAAVREEAEDWRAWVLKVDSPGYGSYAVLTLCRALYSTAHGEQASKLRAAEWTAREMPEWADLIAAALRTRTAVARDEPATFDLPATVHFVNAVADRISARRE